MINRSAIILKYKPPAVSWINEADPIEEHPGITIEDVNEDRTIYLIALVPLQDLPWEPYNFLDQAALIVLQC